MASARASFSPSTPTSLVDDVFESAEFYRDVLGFRFEQFWGDPPRFVMVRRDRVYPPSDQPHDCREFEVEDLDGYVICFGQDLLA